MTDSHSTDMDKWCNSSDCTQAENRLATKLDLLQALERINKAIEDRENEMKQGKIISVWMSGAP